MLHHYQDLIEQGDSDSKEYTLSAGDLDSVPGLGRSPGEGNGYLLQYSCLENPRTEDPGYSPWGCKESDMTEQLRLSLYQDLTRPASWHMEIIFLASC